MRQTLAATFKNHRGHDVLARVSRNERRVLLRSEEKHRSSGDWGPWETLKFPRGTVGKTGWLIDIMTAHKNRVFSVLERDAGVAKHFAVSSLSEQRPSWWEMQRIKDELASVNATAVEVYPPHAEIVDDANMFHIWVLSEPLPFSLARARGDSP